MPLQFIRVSLIGYSSLTRRYEFYPCCQKTTHLTGNEQLASEFSRQLSTIPPKTAAWGQLGLASICSRTENLWWHLGRVTPIITQGATVLPEAEIHNKDDHADEEITANMEDTLSDGLGDNFSDVLANNPSKSEPTTHSAISSMRKMMDNQREMLNNAIQQNTRLCMYNAKLMEATGNTTESLFDRKQWKP